jgi:thymidylate synthase
MAGVASIPVTLAPRSAAIGLLPLKRLGSINPENHSHTATSPIPKRPQPLRVAFVYRHGDSGQNRRLTTVQYARWVGANIAPRSKEPHDIEDEMRYSPTCGAVGRLRAPVESMSHAHFVSETLDDVLRLVIHEIVACGERIHPTKGPADEITGVLLEISNPRARLSRTETRGRIFSALGELCWYLAGSKDAEFISYYLRNYRDSAENGEIFGGYGPRLFSWKEVNQISNVIRVLGQRDSRRAVIQLFDARDIAEKHEDVPCTCTLQFLLRQGKLHLFTNMRSNDVHLGLPHDVFCFTMLQEIIARSVSVELGTYKHAVGSLHLYVKDAPDVECFLGEGLQPTSQVMPAMPPGDPWPSTRVLLEAESAIRNGLAFDERRLAQFEPYWADLARLLQAFQCKKRGDVEGIIAVRARMSSGAYFPFIDRVIRQLEESN